MYYTIHSVRPIYSNELYHHGVKGQRWGVRRFQNPDGTLTPAGKKRYRSNIVNFQELSRDAVRTGAAYKRALNEENRTTKALSRANSKILKKDSLSKKDKEKIDKLTAKNKAAIENEAFWRSRNKNVVSEVESAQKALNRKNKANMLLSNVGTSTLKNGQKIIDNHLAESSAMTLGTMSTAALATGNPYFIAAVLGGGSIGTAASLGTNAAINSAYKRRVEKSR